MARTKKIGIAGKYGARYGRTIKKKINMAEKKQKAYYKCPTCHAIKVKRISSGIWGCRKCGVKFAGKAYEI